MLQSFFTHIKKEHLFLPSDKILLTVSGGIDSVVMCELFHQAKFNFGIAHCNFNLRNNESDEDETFVEALAEHYHVSSHNISFDTKNFATKKKLSIQVAARQLRYDWFEEVRKQFNYRYIATAHHRDDSIETFFINLIRGTGITGLHGILSKHGYIIRPLLFTNKEEVLLFAKKNKLKHREDSSNASDKYVRNKIRHHLIPLLKELNPDIENTIAEDIERLREVEIILKNEIEIKKNKILVNEKNNISISIKKLKKLKSIHTYLFEFLKPFGFNSANVKEIINSLGSISGKLFLSETHRLIKDRETLIIENISSLKKENKTHSISKTQKEIKIGIQQLNLSTTSIVKNFKPSSSKNIASIDFHKLHFPLEIRKWEKGDVFQPLGMKGKKKLSDYFIDEKFSISKKETTWLLTSEDEIVWIIGERLDDRFKINKKTKKIYFVSLV